MGSSSFKAGLGKLSGLFSSPVGGKSGQQAMPIGVDFGVGALKMIQVGGAGGHDLVGLAAAETPPELLGDHTKRLEFQMAQVPRLLKEGGFKGRRAICAIPSWRVFCKHLQVTKQDGLALSLLIDGAIPSQLGCDPSSVLHRFTEVGTVNGRTEVIVIASPRDFIERLVRGMTAAKLEPVGMHSEFLATLRAFDGIHRRDKDVEYTTLYLDIGCGTTNVMIAHGTALAFARVVGVGGMHLDEAIAKQAGCSVAEARLRRAALGVTAPPPPRTVVVAAQPVGNGISAVVEGPAQRREPPAPLPGLSPEVTGQPASLVAPEGLSVHEPLEIMTDEVQMCLRYHASQHPARRVDRVIFVGGEARYRGLCQHLARALKVPGFMADPLTRLNRKGNEPAVGVDTGQPQPAWAVALGLCLSPTDL